MNYEDASHELNAIRAELGLRPGGDTLEALRALRGRGQFAEGSTCPKVVCLDFDGVCTTFESGWHGDTVADDPPVPGLWDAIWGYIRAGWGVAVYSVRSASAEGRRAMRRWFIMHGPSELVGLLSFPEHKPAARVYIDDRAYRFCTEKPVWPSADTLWTLWDSCRH